MTKKTILVTGGGGYIGSVLTSELLKHGYGVKVLDRLYFGIESIEEHLNNPDFELIQNDIRYVNKSVFENVDAVLHLAALSNDPLCEIDPKITKSINYRGTIRIAKLAKEMGVKRFIFSSSCSIYGSSEDLQLTEESPLNPVSQYAKSKIMAEKELLKLADDNFIVTILRNGTVYGLSKRMRFDLVVNIMTLHAFKNKKIQIAGDGLQWRPNVHVQDVAKAFLITLEAPNTKIQRQIFNVGSSEQNYQVIQIANMVKSVMPETVIEYVLSDPDRRNYNVNFDKIKNVFDRSVGKSVMDGIKEIKEGLEKRIITDDIKTKTLDYYKYLLEANKIIKNVSLREKIL